MNAESLAAPAVQAALSRLYAVRPVWTTVGRAGNCVGLLPMTLLHAGPPFSGPPSAPVLSSAILCCLYEGWASTQAQAQAMIADGRVALLPAQNYNVVTPLAAVISPGTSLVEVVDGSSCNARRCWSLLSSGAGPQIRFGTRNRDILERMAWRDQRLAPVLRAALKAAPIDLIPLAIAALRGGDDLHSRTSVATSMLIEQLSESLAGATDVILMLETTPLFFLTLWMAACHLMLGATRSSGPDDATKLVLALCGNGIDAGVRLADQPDLWITTPAHVPQGPRMTPGANLAAPMLGDSGVIDAAGFGAQAWLCNPKTAQDLHSWLPGDSSTRPKWLVGSHPAFAPLQLGSAIDASRVSTAEQTPRVAIAMLDASGEKGLLGRGVCMTDPALFGEEPSATPVVNDPAVMASLNQAFDRYELALTSNDVAALDELFWDSPHTLRYGAGEHLYGYQAIQAFRQARPGTGLDRVILERSITSFASEFAVANIVFRRAGQVRLGRQTQSWARIAGQWRIVAAHVSWLDA